MKRSDRKTSTRSALRALAPYLKHHIPELILSLLLAAGSVALTLYVPILIGRAINGIAAAGKVEFDTVAAILPRVVVAVLLTAVFQWLIGILNNKLSFEIVRDLRHDAFEKIERLPLSYLDSHPSGELVSRVIADADALSDGLLMGFTQLFTGVLTILGTLAFLVYLNPWIALAVVVLTPLSLFVARFIARRTYTMFRAQSETRGEQTALIDEMIAGQKTVQAFSYEDRSMDQFAEINERLRRTSLRATFFSSLTNPSTRFINNLVYAAVALIGAAILIRPDLLPMWAAFAVGDLSSCLMYANQYTKPFNEISGVVTELQNAFACTLRLTELIQEEPETPDAPDAVVLGDTQGAVNLSDVAFSYVPERPLIRDLNLSVRPGMRVAIVGPTGCGKTTLINLLMRFYDVSGGTIQVDGHDLRQITRHSLRSHIGMVLQDTWIRNATVRDNLLMGREGISDEQMIAACREAHAHSFIRRLADGYDTVLAGDGGGLSAGQRQLLCIARVMLSNPAILILDEATSSIDTRTEVKIQDAFDRLMRGRTTFIVAHRLSTIRTADVILVMRDGQVIEQGTHDALLAAGGFYATLYNSQFEP